MRIKEIEINNFKALYGKYTIELGNSGRNLMIYGENGSGKSSFCQALQLFFQASQQEIDITTFRNVFNGPNKDSSYIKITFRDRKNNRDKSFTLNSRNKKINDPFIAAANKRKAFLDYRQLIQTHLVDSKRVDLFEILVEDILYYAINPISQKPIGEEWEEIKAFKIDRRKRKEYDVFIEKLKDYSSGLKQLISEIEQEANQLIQEFKYNIQIHLKPRLLTVTDENEISGNHIYLDVDFFDKKEVPDHHHFLNEARLTALAISIFLGSVLNIPGSAEYKILVLDDIFIGLDTSNRIPLLEILRKKFKDYQIFMATYDRQWYELVKMYTKPTKWHSIEMYVQEEHQNGYEIPIIHDKTNFIDRAEYHLQNGDFKAAAVYLRSEFERLLKSLCNDKGIAVKYKIQSHKMDLDSFWQAVQNIKFPGTTTPLFTDKMKKDILQYRALILNPFSHYDLTRPQFRSELVASINLLKQIRSRLKEKMGIS